MKNLYLIFPFAAISIFFSCKEQEENYEKVSYFTINENGELAQPTDYRSWVYVGTPVTPNELNNGKAAFPEFHNVYIDPESYDYWKENGEFRDGTILIKELISVGSKQAVSGNGYFMGDFIGLEATIKSKEHFPDEPGNWAYFSFSNPGKNELKDNVMKFETNACNSCHQNNAADDFVFTQYYPVLRAAKGVGTENPENSNSRTTVGGMENEWEATAETPDTVDSEVPVDKDEIFAYLQSLEYRKFETQESEMHPSMGPHTKEGFPVKVFMNDRIAESLENGNAEHPLGSAIVKEMYSEENELSGWAVMVKTHNETNEGNGWFWYEVTSTNDANSLAAIGNGVSGCISCHNIAGQDMVRTFFPLK